MFSLSKPLTVLATLALVVIVIAGLKATASILVPLMIATVLAVLASGPLLWIESKGVNHTLAALAVIIFMSVIVFAFITSLRISISDISSMMPHYQELFNIKFEELNRFAMQFGVDIHTLSITETQAFKNILTTGIKGVGSILSNTLIVLFILFFILFEVASFPKKMEMIWKHGEATVESIKEVVNNINHYIAIKTATSLLTGTTVALFTYMLGIDFALFLGIIAFVLNFIPTIGSIIAAIPAILIAWLTLGVDILVYTTIGYLVINISISNLIEPKFMGKGLGLSALVVFLSLIFWGWVFGIVGMLFSAILTMIIKISLASSKESKWIATLIDDPKM